MITDTIYKHLEEVQSTKIKSLISKAVIIEPSDTLSSVINKISKNDAYDVFYFNGRSILSTNIRALLNAKNITEMKVESFLYPIPYLSPNDSVQKAANIIAHYRIREVPIVQKNKIIGVVNVKRILRLISTKDNKWIKANLIHTKNPTVISSKETLSNARRIMISKRIDHLPVLNNGKIKQVLTSAHILEYILPQERQGKKSVGVRTLHKLESKIGNIGTIRFPQCTPSDDLNYIVNLMLKTNTSGCLVNLWDNLIGIITFRDILGLLTSKIETPIPLYIVGLPEDQKNVNLISKKFEDTLKRIQKVYSEIHEARVSIKQQRTGNKKEGTYEVSIMIITSHHAPLIFSSVGFDLSEVLEELSQKLLKILSKRAKNRSKTSIRKIGSPMF
ncbi:MAG: CBS domain-containing protein [Nitrosopumilus sp.]|nr:CBS domain-containing protein [Nitrosopumilus sp.]MDH3516848.1 CBS domain-containing protein [Nitrosopumilus sp.]MDH3565200.1 CBS domain-containing protein [Nitrosopumilus sp.]MDH5417591.1 CBS domain-containing protein [Nitrosopumilus sp.]MDH5555288.1 CBS domain-containing protein [Nitrosopumilus sp.]